MTKCKQALDGEFISKTVASQELKNSTLIVPYIVGNLSSAMPTSAIWEA